MYGIDVLDIYDNPVEYLTQWDVDQRLRIKVYSDDTELLKIRPNVHFCNSIRKEALVVRSTVADKETIVVDVPNALLEEPYAIVAYIYLTDRTIVSSQKSIVRFEIPVKKRQRPHDHEYVENIERITAEKIKEEIADEIGSGILDLTSFTLIDANTGKQHKVYAKDGKLLVDMNSEEDDEQTYSVLDTRDKTELDEKIDANKADANSKIADLEKKKVNVSDIVNDLETSETNKPLSAAMGVELKRYATDISDSTANEKVSAHNVAPEAHADIRSLITGLTERLDTLADSDDENLNQLSEIVSYIKNNKELIDALAANKVNASDIVNDLVTNETGKPLSAAMGVELKKLIDEMVASGAGNVDNKITEHNAAADSHTDIRDAVSAAHKRAEEAYTAAMAGGGEAALGIETHDKDPLSHQDIRELVTKAQTDASTALEKIESGVASSLTAGTGIEIVDNAINIKPAAAGVIGGVKAGENVTIAEDGTISTEAGGFMDDDSFINALTSYYTRYRR